ncbi:MAG TPA: ribosome-recycling factor [Candidatus Paceibacterota bacterium]|jgi:ribosome recycling factor|nr:ribosome-recycling factor [Candidatus Paceibacterota bacterium]HRS47758.1 ribosome-recycling factor [Candidatus Paceibacterota bacterium]
MDEIISKFRKNWQEIIRSFKMDLNSLRSGRVSPAIIEDLTVEAYGNKMKLKELASIAVQPPNILIVQVWDETNLGIIEKAITGSNLGVNVSREGKNLKVIFPPLTEEKRKTLIKMLNQKEEEFKIKFRNSRDEVREQIKEKFEQKEITEDDKYRLIELLQKEVDEFNNQISEISKRKEEELKGF